MAFYDWMKNDKEFSNKILQAEARGQMRVEKAIVKKKAIEDPGHALAIARRRYPEYQDRQITKHEGGEDFGKNATVVDVKEVLKDVDISEEDKEKIRDAVNKRQFPGRGFSKEEG